MVRKQLIRTDNFPYHITTRSNNQDWFEVPKEEIWKEFLRLLEIGIEKYGVSPHCFTLMSNHYHLLISTPHENIDDFMQFFNSRLSIFIGEKSGRINRIFGGRYKWSLISHKKYYGHVYRYIYQNPLRAGLCSKVEDYPFTSINLEGHYPKIRRELKENLRFFIPFHFQGAEGLSYYVNSKFSKTDEEWMRKGLGRSEFKPRHLSLATM